MQQDILINWSPQETRVAVVEQGAVQELHIERTLERGLVGNIYLGKVSRVLPGMQSAFIDIGLERAAFLHVADVWQRHESGDAPMIARKNEPPKPIEHQVFEGQSLVVQVIKDPIGTKGARLSTQISIAGRFGKLNLVAECAVVEHFFDDGLAVVEIAFNCQRVNIGFFRRGHLALLNRRNFSMREKDEDIGAVTSAKCVNRCAACVAGCGANNGCTLVALCQNIIH